MAFALTSALGLLACSGEGQDAASVPAAEAGRYAALDALPNFGGYWMPQAAPPYTPPLTEAAKAQIAKMQADTRAGNPPGFRASCVPRSGYQFWNVGTGSPKEIEMTPHYMFVWSSSGNGNLRRIYIDGRGHSSNTDLSYTGESVATWEGDTLVVDTINFKESVHIYSAGDSAVENGGDMHMLERFRLTDPDTLQVDIEITAPKVLTEKMAFTRTFKRNEELVTEYKEEYICSEANPYIISPEGYQTLDTTPPSDLVLPPS